MTETLSLGTLHPEASPRANKLVFPPHNEFSLRSLLLQTDYYNRLYKSRLQCVLFELLKEITFLNSKLHL